ncbi:MULTISPECIES: hypothetical protein [Ralstonia]|jgi:hypothetical protein|nr:MULTISPECIES: hypothetical protein [Ralstonia]MBX3905235.1 hypothetical protein [Ralstonia insidiosa]SCW98189.1 hypothetical protein SAMN02799637_04707 [Ralstonia sp. UNCCL144]
MKLIAHIAIAAACSGALVSTAHAFGEVGRWTSGWGQGTSEYTVVDAKRNALYIACSEDRPVSMSLTVAGKEYGSYTQQEFSLIIDGKEISTPYATSSRVGADNFRYAWDAMRKAKSLQAKTADGKVVTLPLVNAAKALPSSKSREFACRTEF